MKDICQIIQDDLKLILNEKRYNHTLGVVSSALKLSEMYKEDKQKAKIASLLHDVAKQMKEDEIKALVEKYNIEFDEIEKVNHQLKHAKLGAYIARYHYNIQDEDILNAIRFHTTGRENMSKLEIIICLSDYIEEGRSFDAVEKIRELSQTSLEKALYYALNNTAIYILQKNEILHPNTLKARNFLLEKLINH